MAVTAKKKKARLDFTNEIDEVVAPTVGQEDVEVVQPVPDNKIEVENTNVIESETENDSNNTLVVEATKTAAEVKEQVITEDKAEEEMQDEETEDELDILLNRLQTGKGVQKSVYIEEDVYNFIQAKCEKTNAKFSNVFNLLARSAIKQQNKK